MKQPSIELLRLCQLYVALKQRYIDNCNDWINLADWFGFSQHKTYINDFPNWEAPDVCARCFRLYATTVGGRLRDECNQCFHNKEMIFDTFCIYNLAQCIGVNFSLLEAHIAEAIFISETIDRTIHERTDEIQPNIKDDTGTDTPRVRRFNITPNRKA